MARKMMTLAEVAAKQAIEGVPLTIQAVRYRIQKSNRGGAGIKVRKMMGPKKRLVDGITDNAERTLWRLWKNLHLK